MPSSVMCQSVTLLKADVSVEHIDLIMEEIRSSETADFRRGTQGHIQEGAIFLSVNSFVGPPV
jgi:hypothetical protein